MPEKLTVKDGMSQEAILELEQKEFKEGPLSVLLNAVEDGGQVMVSCRNNKKLVGRVRGFDRHCNMVLENVKELWTETTRTAKGKKGAPVNKTRHISKMFVRGDCVVLVLRRPATAVEA